MTTRTVMIAEMESDMERSDHDAFVAKIDAAIRHYQSKRFWFNESRDQTFSTSDGVDLYTFDSIGAEFYRLDGVFITVEADDVRELDPWNYARIEQRADEMTETDVPCMYAYINKAIRLWRAPDAAYEVRLLGHKKIAAPQTDGENSNPWMMEAYDLIMCRAKAELYAHRYEDPGNAQIMRVAEQEALTLLQGATEDKVAPGYLEATEF